MRASLAQTGRWLVDRGEAPESELHDVPREFTAEEIKNWCVETDVPGGRLTHLGPALRLSETAPHWTQAHGAPWLPRPRVARAVDYSAL